MTMKGVIIILLFIGLTIPSISTNKREEVEFKSNPLPRVLDCTHGHAEVVSLPTPQDCSRFNSKLPEEDPLFISGSIWELDERRFYIRGYSCVRHTLTKKCVEGFFGAIWESEWSTISSPTEQECHDAPVRSDPEVFAYECYYMTTKEVTRSWIEKVPFQSTVDHQTGEIYLNSIATSVDAKLGFFVKDNYMFMWKYDNILDFDPKCNHVKIKDIKKMIITIENATTEGLLKISIPEEYLLYYLPKSVHEIVCHQGEKDQPLYQTTSGQYISFSRNINDIWNVSIDRKELSEKYSESRGGEAYIGSLLNIVSYKSINERYYQNCLQRNKLIQSIDGDRELTSAELEVLTHRPNCVGKITGKELKFLQCDYLSVTHYVPDIYSNLKVKVKDSNKWVYYDPWKQQVVDNPGPVMSLGRNRVVTFANSVTINMKTNQVEHVKETPYKPIYNPEHRMMRLKNASVSYNKLDNLTIWTSVKNTTSALYESGWDYMFNNPFISHMKGMLNVVHWIHTFINTMIWILIVRAVYKLYLRFSVFGIGRQIIAREHIIREE